MKHYLVDSHCHLNYPELKNDLDNVIANAQDKGVGVMLTVNVKLSEADDLAKIADAYDNVYFSVGVHPNESSKGFGGELTGQQGPTLADSTLVDALTRLSRHPKMVGIGETGLDYHYNHSPREQQINFFEQHLQVATALNLPIIIHTRDADGDTISCLDKFPSTRGVFHCFSGSASLAMAALERGYYLSFSGIITFSNADSLREIVRTTPIDRILVETDAPFLAPIPHRGKRNEPAYARLNAEKIADIKGITFEEVAEHTTNNFFQLFNRAKPYYADRDFCR